MMLISIFSLVWIFCNAQMKPSQIQNNPHYFFSFLSYTTCCWHCTMQSCQQFASKYLREIKIPNIKR
jgi:hypothetical protein